MKGLLLVDDVLCPDRAETDSSIEVVVKTQSSTTMNSVAFPRNRSPVTAVADHSEIFSTSNQWDDSPSTAQPSSKQNAESETPPRHVSNRLRLPGMIPPLGKHTTETASPQNDSTSPLSPSIAPPVEAFSESSSSMTLPTAKAPPSPRRHSRIPSTGSRITVMEVSQSLNEVANSQNPLGSYATPIGSAHEPASPVEMTLNSRTTLSQLQAEKRKSSYEKYSAIILPPLKEETTPIQTPVGTLTRIDVNQCRTIGEVERQNDLNQGHSKDDVGPPVMSKPKDIVVLGK